MKNKLVGIIVLIVAITPALFARDSANDKNAQRSVGRLSVSEVGNPPLTAQLISPVVPNEQKQRTQVYDAAMVAITQRFSATLASIAEAVQQGKIRSEQGREMSAELYDVSEMQV